MAAGREPVWYNSTGNWLGASASCSGHSWRARGQLWQRVKKMHVLAPARLPGAVVPLPACLSKAKSPFVPGRFYCACAAPETEAAKDRLSRRALPTLCIALRECVEIPVAVEPRRLKVSSLFKLGVSGIDDKRAVCRPQFLQCAAYSISFVRENI